MSDEGGLSARSRWFATPSFVDLRLAQWRSNHDEARAIARYLRWSAERSGKARRSPDSTRDRK